MAAFVFSIFYLSTLLVLPAFSRMIMLPEHLMHGEIANELCTPAGTCIGRPGKAFQELKPQYLEVPLDHFDPSNKATMNLKYYVVTTHWKAPQGPIFITMPSEGSLYGAYSTFLARNFSGMDIMAEHRFFGTSVPGNDSSTENLMHYLSVEQNLADQAMLAKHVAQEYKASGPIIAQGGSYSGASAAWMRETYPTVVTAAISESGPVAATKDFYEYDQSLARALADPSNTLGASCKTATAATMRALDRLMAKDMNEVKRRFNASNLIGHPMGDIDFMYGLGDSVASAVQYGRKDKVCKAMAKLPAHPTDDEYADNFANYTLSSWGSGYFHQCFYDSDCMRTATHDHIAQAARSWYWFKCSTLGYLQTSPPVGSPMRPKGLTVDNLVKQCRYIFDTTAYKLPSDAPQTSAFNSRHGAKGPYPKTTSRIFFLDYSDDPWQMASVNHTLGVDLPYAYYRHSGCGHCGSGCPMSVIESMYKDQVIHLQSWLG